MSVLVGREAPDFTAPAVLADGTIVNGHATFSDNETQLISEMKEKLRDEYNLKC